MPPVGALKPQVCIGDTGSDQGGLWLLMHIPNHAVPENVQDVSDILSLDTGPMDERSRLFEPRRPAGMIETGAEVILRLSSMLRPVHCGLGSRVERAEIAACPDSIRAMCHRMRP